MQIDNYWNILLLGLIPLFVIFIFQFIKWKKNKQNLFADSKFHAQLFEKKYFFSKILPWLYTLAFSFLILSLLNFISHKEEKFEIPQKSSDVVFLIDVSNSMNAEDIAPSRLELTKKILSQSLKKLSDERISIVVFAGEARSIMPLTTDYSSADIFLNNINSQLIQVQGTDFLIAVNEAQNKLKNATSGTKKIILISDGEDNEGNHNATIREAQRNNISITTVGVGTDEGAPIPELLFNYYSDYKRDENGQIIITKRQSSALKDIAKETNGIYIDGNSENDAINKIIKDIKKSNKKTGKNNISNLSTNYYYQWFLSVSILLFFIIYLFNPKKNLDF